MQVGRYCRGSEYLDVLVKLPFIIILAVRMSTGNTEISAGIIAGNYFIRFTYSVLISQCQNLCTVWPIFEHIHIQ